MALGNSSNLDELNLTWGEEPDDLKHKNPELSCYKSFPKWWINYHPDYKQPHEIYVDKNNDKILKEKHIYYLHNVLLGNECEQYIKASEQFGYDKSFEITKLGKIIQQHALKTNTPIIWPSHKTIRNNKRLIWQIEQNETNRIYALLKASIPKDLHTFYDEINDRKWDMVGLNARFRFFKYESGDVFKPHIDAACASLKNEIYQRSFLSVVVYLNDDFENGQTQFFNDYNELNQISDDEKDKQEDNGKVVNVFPKQGSALIFYHDGAGKYLSKRHCALPPKNGTKYIIRTDLMFKETKG